MARLDDLAEKIRAFQATGAAELMQRVGMLDKRMLIESRAEELGREFDVDQEIVLSVIGKSWALCIEQNDKFSSERVLELVRDSLEHLANGSSSASPEVRNIISSVVNDGRLGIVPVEIKAVFVGAMKEANSMLGRDGIQ